jgi:aspartate kinase
MKVFKFGGASISNIERFRNTSKIIGSAAGEKLLVVISAMGKTTNALEEVATQYFTGNSEKAKELFEKIKTEHINILTSLVEENAAAGISRLKDIFTEIEWLTTEKPVRHFDYYYDQMVCCGELLSSIILSYYLESQKIKNHWIDARDIIRTDNNFREASVNWNLTGSSIKESVLPLFNNTNILIIQGFIGCTDENESTTLGREGSDYSAAIFANQLSAESLTIWKDVESVMNADPRRFPDAVKLKSLSYTEVIEMAFYGAQVIHPKTIKPLQNKNIPLLVKSFIDPSLQGTVISKEVSKNLPPIIVNKEKQVLIQFKSKDFSFVEDSPVQELHEIFRTVRIKPNVSQHTAISLLCCFDDHAEKIDQLAQAASAIFDVTLERNLTLLTIRHYNEEKISLFTKGKIILLEQKTTDTVQVVMR